jgi:hypothetical protein
VRLPGSRRRLFADAAIAIRDEGDLSSLSARLPLDDWLA